MEVVAALKTLAEPINVPEVGVGILNNIERVELVDQTEVKNSPPNIRRFKLNSCSLLHISVRIKTWED